MSPTIFFAVDFIPRDYNSFIVIIHALHPSMGAATHKGMERIVTNYQYLPALQCKGALLNGGLKVLTG